MFKNLIVYRIGEGWRPSLADAEQALQAAHGLLQLFHGVGRGKAHEVGGLERAEVAARRDGQVGALYGQWPPLANPIKGPGEWNSYDIVFEAPRFDAAGNLTKPAFMTVILNGVVMHNRKELNGPTNHRSTDPYKAYSGRGPISLQDHGNATRFRNIWIREIKDDN